MPLKLVLAGTIGVLLGLLLTLAALTPNLRGVSAGPWHGSPREGAVDADAYALASIERAGTLPPGAAEGVSFTATRDGSGSPLSSSCSYKVGGAIPPARYWTLSVLTPDGFPIANPAGRYGFTSAEVLREGEAPPEITVSAEARGGNWLPVGGKAAPFVLMLRLYDTGLSAAGAGVSGSSLPMIVKLECR